MDKYEREKIIEREKLGFVYCKYCGIKIVDTMKYCNFACRIKYNLEV